MLAISIPRDARICAMPPADSVTTDQPKHPLHALTTYELKDYRRSLEHAIRTLPERTPVRQQLRARLDAVLAEVEDRARLARG
jgi:hypothetical protein